MSGAAHIGVLCTSYPRSPGDPAGNFVLGLNRYLRGRGCDVTVLCAGDGAAREEAWGPAGERVLRLPSSLFYGGGAPERLFRGGGEGLAAAIEGARFSAALLLAARRLEGCDALVSHFAVPCGAVAALLDRGRPHLCIAHSSDVHLLRRLRLLPLLWQLGRRADLVYSDESLRPPGAPGRAQAMGIDVAALRASEGRDAARAQMGLARPTALFLGRLVPVKGVAVLLAALRDAPELDLLIAGDGPDRPHLAALAAKLPPGRARLLGEVGPEARARLLGACDLLVLPSLRLRDGRTEGAPTVLREALAAGCPAVASDVGGARALLGGAGILCPPGDAAALAAALRGALDPRWQREARREARRRGDDGDWSVVGPRLCKNLPLGTPAAPRVAAREHPG